MKDKKSLTLPIVGLVILAVLVLLLGTYAYWQVTEKQTNRNLVGSACLSITFSNETGDINLENMWPTSDTDGAALTPYSFTITNTCDTGFVNYTVALEEIKGNSNNPITYPDQYLSDSNLKIKVDTLSPVKISTLDTITSDDEEDYEIYGTKKLITRKLAAGASRTHSIRIWLDANAPISEMDKFFLSKVKIIAGQGINEDCYAVNNEGLLYSYDKDCGTSATVPASVDGHNIVTIASDAFKADVVNYEYSSNVAEDSEQTITSPYQFKKVTPGFVGNYYDDSKCNNSDGTTFDCTLDYSVVYSSTLVPIINSEDPNEIAAAVSSMTSDDIYIIIYNNDSNTTAYSHITDSYTALLTAIYGELSQMGVSFTLNDILDNVYVYGEDTLPDEGTGIAELYYSVEYEDNSWVFDYVGRKIPNGMAYKLVINSLDLSNATYLSKIEDRAFSNAPSLDENILANGQSLNGEDFNASFATGLTSLTFGENDRDIEFGYASFAKSNLTSLTIYSNYHMPRIGSNSSSLIDKAIDNTITQEELSTVAIPENDPISYYATAYGAFGSSTIGTLNVVASNNSTAFDPTSGLVGVYIRVCINQNCGVALGGSLPSLFGSSLSVDTTTNITTLNIDNSIEEIGNGAFIGSNIDNINLPTSLTTIGYEAFYNSNGATRTITLPSNVTTIKSHAFYTFNGTINVPSQALVNNKSDWAPRATVQLSN